jgi:hypothetical protein
MRNTQLTLSLLGVLFLAPTHAFAENAQMLPPTQGAGSVCDFSGSAVPQILTYNGNAVANGTIATSVSAINCIKHFTVDSTGNITSVLTINQNWNPDQAISINSNQIWKSIATGDPALYLQYSNPGGEVSIGGAPGAKNDLAVHGYVNVSSVNGEGGTINLAGNNSVTVWLENLSGKFRLVDSGWVNELFSVDQIGNAITKGKLAVGAGLTVVNGIQIGNSGVGCSGANEGAMQYNFASHTMEYCNGTSWTSFSGGILQFGGLYELVTTAHGGPNFL